jgi:cytochrome P450
LLLFGIWKPASVRANEKFASALLEGLTSQEATPGSFYYHMREAYRARGIHGKALQNALSMLVTAGYPTMAHTIIYTMRCLAKSPAVLFELRNQIDSLVNGPSPVDDAASLSPSRLPLLSHVIYESMRLYPAVPFIARTFSCDTRIAGHPVPKGTPAIVPIWSVLRDPTLWPEPLLFRPDRFKDSAHRDRWIPFSAGPRVCVGQQLALTIMKAIMCMLVKEFDWEVAQPEEEPSFVLRVTLVARTPIRMRFWPRGAPPPQSH